MLIDTHAHLDFPELSDDLDAVLERAFSADVQQIVTIGIDIASSRRAVELAHSHPRLFASVGVHPHDSYELPQEDLEALAALAAAPKVVALGEMGLDYFRDYKPHATQRLCLRRQLDTAVQLGLPVVFHVRNAFDDFLGIVTDYLPRLPAAVLHCFSGDWPVAERCLDLGFYLSIPGTVTFPKAAAQQEVAARAPLERLLVETDAPYLAPVPHRGKVNEPSYVVHTARRIAELRGVALEEVARQTTQNARNVFKMEAPAGGAAA